MEKICAVISGGELSPTDGIENAEFVIACDKGYEYAKTGGITPDLVIGDFDSCGISVDRAIKTVKLPIEKDDTDTLFAIKTAIKKGYKKICVYSALGGRFDHTLANLQAAAYAAEKGCTVDLFGNGEIITVFAKTTLKIEKKQGFSLSVFSLSDECDGVSIKGVKYPLDNFKVTSRFPIGVSNEWVDDFAEITVRQGIAAVVRSKI